MRTLLPGAHSLGGVGPLLGSVYCLLPHPFGDVDSLVLDGSCWVPHLLLRWALWFEVHPAGCFILLVMLALILEVTSAGFLNFS